MHMASRLSALGTACCARLRGVPPCCAHVPVSVPRRGHQPVSRALQLTVMAGGLTSDLVEASGPLAPHRGALMSGT